MTRPQRGFFTVGVWHPKHETNVGSLLRSAALYGAAMVFTVGRRYSKQASDTMHTSNHTPLLHFADIEDLIDHLPHGSPLVGVELAETAVPLGKFKHPERATYLLGAEDHGLPESVTMMCHRLVQIECPAPWSMNVSNAGTLVLYDRFMKGA